MDISEIRFSNCRIRGAARAFEIVGTVVKRPRDIVISNVSVVDVGLVEHSLKVVEYADDVRFNQIDVTPANRGSSQRTGSSADRAQGVFK